MLVILAGLGATLILLAVYGKALPGEMFYTNEYRDIIAFDCFSDGCIFSLFSSSNFHLFGRRVLFIDKAICGTMD
jgi:hypothetical protein